MNEIAFRTYDPFSHHDSVKEIWTSLLSKCPHTYYLSWTWRELWIKSLPEDCGLQMVAGFKDSQPVIAFFVGSNIIPRYNFLKFREISLNSTLNPYYDLLWIEYNGFLIDPSVSISLESLIEHIPVKWDELNITRFSSKYNPRLKFNNKLSDSYNLFITDLKSYYIDLDRVRENDNDYLALISSKKRYQIRRSIKEYEKIGELRLQAAANVKDALEIFHELMHLHQKRWEEEGFPGSFSNQYYIDFHRKLISSRFQHGEIEMLKVTAGSHTLGCLYCFVYEGNVMGYSCGFNYLKGHLYSPGLICHYLAALHNAEKGLSCYEFLEGDDPYKKSLSTDYNEMKHIRIQKRNTKYLVWRSLVKLSSLHRRDNDMT